LAALEEVPAVVVGHSYGGNVAMMASLLRPDLVLAVGAFETPMPWMAWWPQNTSGGIALNMARRGDREKAPAEAAEAFMRSIVGDSIWNRLPDKTKQARRAEGAALLADLNGIQQGHYDPASVSVPVVIGRGSEARGHHLEGSERLRGLLPDAELFVVDGGGHGAHTSHPDGFADFVRRVLGAAANREREAPR
jgi:pimeloyl-ACP methyl ester carboxylesterase